MMLCPGRDSACHYPSISHRSKGNRGYCPSLMPWLETCRHVVYLTVSGGKAACYQKGFALKGTNITKYQAWNNTSLMAFLLSWPRLVKFVIFNIWTEFGQNNQLFKIFQVIRPLIFSPFLSHATHINPVTNLYSTGKNIDT